MNKRTLLPSLAFAGLTALAFAADHPAAGQPVAPVPPDVALTKLKDGNHRFTTSKISEGKPTAEKRAETAQSQHPFAVVVGCADSRTSPEIIFDDNLGDLFVVRTAGNVVDDHALGSIEYAVLHLGVRLIVVMGHERCGAVTAALASDKAPGHVQSLVSDIQPAVKAVKATHPEPGKTLDLTIAENAREVAAKIRSDAQLGDLAKQVRVVSGVYDLDTGVVEWSKE